MHLFRRLSVELPVFGPGMTLLKVSQGCLVAMLGLGVSILGSMDARDPLDQLRLLVGRVLLDSFGGETVAGGHPVLVIR